MNNALTYNPSAVDLDRHMQAKKTQDAAMHEATERAAMDAAMTQVQQWDQAMNRAFKGIISRPTRHRMMQRAAERHEENAHA